jgi:hypothetical protein
MTTTMIEKEIGTDVMTDVMEFTLLGKLTKEKKQKTVRINVTDVLGIYPKPGKKLVADEEEGKKIFPLLKQALNNNCKVEISCQHLNPTEAFVKHAVGQLYGCFELHVVENNLRVVDLDTQGECNVESALRLAQLFHYRKDIYQQVMKRLAEEAGENEEEWI